MTKKENKSIDKNWIRHKIYCSAYRFAEYLSHKNIHDRTIDFIWAILTFINFGLYSYLIAIISILSGFEFQLGKNIYTIIVLSLISFLSRYIVTNLFDINEDGKKNDVNQETGLSIILICFFFYFNFCLRRFCTKYSVEKSQGRILKSRYWAGTLKWNSRYVKKQHL